TLPGLSAGSTARINARIVVILLALKQQRLTDRHWVLAHELAQAHQQAEATALIRGGVMGRHPVDSPAAQKTRAAPGSPHPSARRPHHGHSARSDRLTRGIPGVARSQRRRTHSHTSTPSATKK